MAEYSRLAKGSFTVPATPVTQYINLPFQPTKIYLRNQTAYSAPAQYAVTQAWWDSSMAQGTADIQYLESNGAPWIIAADSVASSGIGTFSAGVSLLLGPQLQIASTTLATSTITTAAAHGLSTGNVVILEGMYQSATTGSPQVSLMPFVITKTGANTFTINWNMNQSNYTALAASPPGAYVRQVLNPYIYAPGQAFISAISYGTTTTVTTTSAHNFVVGQQIAFRIPSVYGPTALNSLPNSTIPGSPVYYYVTSVTSNTVFVCNAVSTGFPTFNTNQTVASVPGLQLPQVVAVGDVNSGGIQYSGGSLYPSPVIPTFSGTSTINGPAIQGAFVNNTSQGFYVGLGVGAVQSSALLLTASSVYSWEAYYFDFG
jgi:hypothetical protein